MKIVLALEMPTAVMRTTAIMVQILALSLTNGQAA